MFYIPLFLSLKINKKKEKERQNTKRNLNLLSIWMRFSDGTPLTQFFSSSLIVHLSLLLHSASTLFLFLRRSSFHSYSSLSFPCFFSPRPPILGGNQSLRGFKLLMEGIRSYSSDVCRPVVSDRYRKRRGKSDIQPNLSTRISFFGGQGELFPTADSSCRSKCKPSSLTVSEVFYNFD